MSNQIQISLKAARVNAGMTQDDVAEKMHISKRSITAWETGKYPIPFISLSALADLYAIPVDCIFLPKKSTKTEMNASA